MQVSSSTASANVSSGGGASSAGQIAQLQKQLKDATEELKAVALDSTLDAKAKEVKQKLLQSQVVAIQQQIAALQQAEAQKAQQAQQKAQEKAQAAEAPRADGDASAASTRKPEGSPLGQRLDVYA
ncbi:hypothetical protein GN316_16200 [Xylophilus sp. Kf1]|nr:hypothetical protein [Xylophilus sp. Kf1]